jgi:hypothetical protein
MRRTASFCTLIFFVLCAWSTASFAQGVYVKQGPNGPVFSDQPAPGAKEVTLKPLNVMAPTPAENKAPAAESETPSQAVVPVDVTKSAAPASDYDRFQIISPENDGSTVANTAVFEVRLAVNPPLRLADQHAFVISLNGRPVNQRFTATEFMVPPEFWEELPPPNQAMQLDASIIDGRGADSEAGRPGALLPTLYDGLSEPELSVLPGSAGGLAAATALPEAAAHSAAADERWGAQAAAPGRRIA